ncbi:MAG TPA: cation:proton antiporter family protein [Gammaproteobacteria bacterium]
MNISIENTFFEFTALLALSAVLGFIAIRLKQPLLIAFILVGILVGPAVFGWVQSLDKIDLLAQLGVTILLFVVGLKLDPKLVRHLGPVALATGLGQLFFTIVFGFIIALGLGMEPMKAIYIAIALTFSSTIIIIKLLSDKRELDSLHGRIAVGFLIVQDIAVVIAMMALSSVKGDAGLAHTLISIFLRLGSAIILIVLLMRYVLPAITHTLAHSQELLLLFAVAWASVLSVGGELLGFSKEVGAFLAGFSLASTTYRDAIAVRLTSLRDFLLLFFFIDLGSKLEFHALGEEVISAIIFSLFVLIGNPLIVLAIMGYMGYRKRTAFMAGLTVAQISEFSIIFIAMGIQLGHIDASALALTTLVGLITITLSTYMILYSERLYEWLSPWMNLFERRKPFREMQMNQGKLRGDFDVIVFGLGRYGSRLLQRLHDQGHRVLGVDFDPEVIRMMNHRNIPVRFGDVEDHDMLEHLPLNGAQWVISTLYNPRINLHLLQGLTTHNYTGKTAMTVHSESDGEQLKQAGVNRILYPFTNAADYAADITAKSIIDSVETTK